MQPPVAVQFSMWPSVENVRPPLFYMNGELSFAAKSRVWTSTCWICFCLEEKHVFQSRAYSFIPIPSLPTDVYFENCITKLYHYGTSVFFCSAVVTTFYYTHCQICNCFG